MGYRNKEKAKEYKKKYDRAHRKEINAWARAYNAEHKEQVRERHRRWRINNIEEARRRERDYQRLHKKEAIKRVEEWNKRHPDKYRAHLIAKAHIPLARNCEICGAKAEHRHHSDYSKPLKVIHLCRICHCKLHKMIDFPVSVGQTGLR